MKKLCFLAMLAVLCACTKETVEVVSGPVTFNAVIEDADATKTSIGSKDSQGRFPILWNAGDSISVFAYGPSSAACKFILSSGEGTRKASFSGTCGKADGYYAIYPYSMYDCLVKDQWFNIYHPYIIWNGQEQVAHKNTWDPSKAVMIAYGQEVDDNVSLNFNNLCAYVKFTTDYACKSVTFESKSGDDVISSTAVQCTYDSGEDMFFADAKGTTFNSIELMADESGVIEPGTYYIAMLPCDLASGFRMIFQSAKNSSKTFEVSTDNEAKLQRGTVLDLGKLEISSGIIAFAGSGTAEDPYQVSDLDELKYLSTVTANGVSGFENPYYIQTADIDCKGETLTPIGTVDRMFAGKYDGGGHKITNAVFGHFESDGRNAAGLFGNIYNATIKNLKVEKCTIKNYGTRNNPAIIFGLIAAHAYSSDGYKCTITNCQTSGTVTYDSYVKDRGAYQVGGILGASNSNIEITYCTNDATFDKFYLCGLSDASMGGILGYAGPVKHSPDNTPDSDALVKIDRCRNNGTLMYTVVDDQNNTNVSIGGIVGRAYDAWFHETAVQISSCVNTGYIGQKGIDYAKESIGGIFGKNDSDGSSSMRPSIFNCLNTGSIFQEAKEGYCGGIIGYNYNNDTSISMCVHAGHFNVSSSLVDTGAISGSFVGTYHHIFNVDSDILPLRHGGKDSVFTDGSGYYDEMTVSALNNYVAASYSDKNAAAWKYVDPSAENFTLDLDF